MSFDELLHFFYICVLTQFPVIFRVLLRASSVEHFSFQVRSGSQSQNHLHPVQLHPHNAPDSNSTLALQSPPISHLAQTGHILVFLIGKSLLQHLNLRLGQGQLLRSQTGSRSNLRRGRGARFRPGIRFVQG